MITQPLGKVSVTPEGEWSSASAYEYLDIVTDDGSSYMAVSDVPAGTALTDTGHWMLLAQKGDTGLTGNGIDHVTLNPDYTLTVYYTNGTFYTTGPIRGERGEKGETGDCKFAAFDLDPQTGELSVAYTNDNSEIEFSLNNKGYLGVEIE